MRSGDLGGTCAAGSHPSLPCDSAEVQRVGDHRVAEGEERLGGDELRVEIEPNGARTAVLGARVLRQHGRIG